MNQEQHTELDIAIIGSRLASELAKKLMETTTQNLQAMPELTDKFIQTTARLAVILYMASMLNTFIECGICADKEEVYDYTFDKIKQLSEKCFTEESNKEKLQ